MHPKHLLLASALAWNALAALPALAHEAIRVEAPHVRLVPPGTSNTAAFMVIRNSGSTDRTVVQAQSPAAKVVELHNHINDNGVMRMRPVDKIEIKAGGQAELKPGGLHIMLIGLTRSLKEGETVPITLKLDDGSSTRVEVPVRPILPATGIPAEHGHHH